MLNSIFLNINKFSIKFFLFIFINLKKILFFILFFILLLFINYYFFKENYIFCAYDSGTIDISYFEKEDIDKWILKYENDPTVNFSLDVLDMVTYNMNFNQTKNSLSIFHTCYENNLVNRGNPNDLIYPDDRNTVNVPNGRIMYIENDNFRTEEELVEQLRDYNTSRVVIDPAFKNKNIGNIDNFNNLSVDELANCFNNSSVNELKELADCFDRINNNCLDKFLLEYPKRVQYIVKIYYLNNPLELEYVLKNIEKLEDRTSAESAFIERYAEYSLDANGHYAFLKEKTINNKTHYDALVCTHGSIKKDKFLTEIKQINLKKFADKTTYVNESIMISKNNSILNYKSPPFDSYGLNQLIYSFKNPININKINNFSKNSNTLFNICNKYLILKIIK